MLFQHLYDIVLFEYISGYFFVHVLLQWLATGPLKFTQMHHINDTNRNTTIALKFVFFKLFIIYSSQFQLQILLKFHSASLQEVLKVWN